MKKSMKYTLLLLAVFPLLLAGCLNDLFDKGDTEKVYDGPTVVGFSPLETETDEGDGAITIEVQLIGEQRGSDLPVNFSVDGASSTAVAGTHYNLTSSSPVTIASNSSIATISINILADSGLESGDEVRLILTLEGSPGEGVEAAENLDSATIFIAGVTP